MVKTSKGDAYFKTEVISDPYLEDTMQGTVNENGIPIRIHQVQPLGIRNQFLTYSFNNITVETPIIDQFESLNTALPDHISDNDYRNSIQNSADYDYWNSPNENYDLSEPDWLREQREAVALFDSRNMQRLEEFDDIQGNLSKSNYYEGDIKPEPNTIFVFGSNTEGRHGLGAAKIAREQFGAVYGQGEGLQGNAYALPTKDLRVKENRSLKSISPKQIIDSIIKLYDVAEQNPNKQFKIAYRNTIEPSLNGYTGLEMIEMFNDAAQIGIGYIPSNVIFSKEWVDTGKLNIQSGITPQQTNVQPSGTINVYWGQAESETSTKILSNLAPRRFTFEGREYGSVEHAYQSNKSGTFDEATYNAYNKIGGYGKKIRGKGTVAEMKDANNLELMKRLVVESFKQNPNSEAAKKLMQYENFTHNTNTVIDKAFLEGLKLAQRALLQINSVGEIVSETSLFDSNVLIEQVGKEKIEEYKNKCKNNYD